MNEFKVKGVQRVEEARGGYKGLGRAGDTRCEEAEDDEEAEENLPGAQLPPLGPLIPLGPLTRCSAAPLIKPLPPLGWISDLRFQSKD